MLDFGGAQRCRDKKLWRSQIADDNQHDYGKDDYDEHYGMVTYIYTYILMIVLLVIVIDFNLPKPPLVEDELGVQMAQLSCGMDVYNDNKDRCKIIDEFEEERRNCSLCRQ